MKNIFVSSGQVISALGFTTEENFRKIENGETGIKHIHDDRFSKFPFFAACIDDEQINSRFEAMDNGEPSYTRLEKLFILSISGSLQQTGINLKNADTLLIIASTKGNINVLEGKNQDLFKPGRAYLSELAHVIQQYFGLFHKPLIVCNACISGVSALIYASRLISAGKYRHIVVTGGDIVSAFTVAGFMAFKAIGSSACKPYDSDRDGLSLGEGVATLIVSADRNMSNTAVPVKILGGSVTNDANHISGPSRTGDGLSSAIETALTESELVASQIGYISAHGTATPFNDEMESLAFNTAGLQQVPVNSFKGALGHTLGAAGIIESVLTIESLIRKTVLPSVGFRNSGVSMPIRVIQAAQKIQFNYALKTASGFGGCNAAVLFSKTDEQ